MVESLPLAGEGLGKRTASPLEEIEFCSSAAEVQEALGREISYEYANDIV